MGFARFAPSSSWLYREIFSSFLRAIGESPLFRFGIFVEFQSGGLRMRLRAGVSGFNKCLNFYTPVALLCQAVQVRSVGLYVAGHFPAKDHDLTRRAQITQRRKNQFSGFLCALCALNSVPSVLNSWGVSLEEARHRSRE